MRPFLVEIALAVADFRHHSRPSQHRLGGLRRRQPPLRLLLGQRAPLMRCRHSAVARPHPARRQPQNAARLGVQPQHRVQQHATPDTFADLAQAAITLLGRREVDLAGILDRQHMPARASLGDVRAPALDQRRHRDPRVGKKSREANNAPAPAPSQTAQADTLPRHHPRQQQTPLFARRSSPNAPSRQTSADIAITLPPNHEGSNHPTAEPVNHRQTDHHSDVCIP